MVPINGSWEYDELRKGTTADHILEVMQLACEEQ